MLLFELRAKSTVPQEKKKKKASTTSISLLPLCVPDPAGSFSWLAKHDLPYYNLNYKFSLRQDLADCHKALGFRSTEAQLACYPITFPSAPGLPHMPSPLPHRCPTSNLPNKFKAEAKQCNLALLLRKKTAWNRTAPLPKQLLYNTSIGSLDIWANLIKSLGY